MLAYVMVGTNDLDRAAKFYDALFSAIGVKRMMEMEKSVAWGSTLEQPAFAVTLPHDGKPATVGNGSMVALRTASPDEVKALHAKALELGGADEGAPGPRGDQGFYAAYFRDLDGNKLNAFCMTAG